MGSNVKKKKNVETAVLACGCFWGVQAVFDKVKGVVETTVGYTGGSLKYPHPTYQQVCSGKTGHAEAIKIEFDPRIIRYNEILEIFWMNHDPTTLNQQGPDYGEQYRSAIFFLDEKQKMDALKSLKEFQKKLKKPIVTQVVKAKEFFNAEDYHQKYYLSHNVSCNIKLPKL